MTKSESKYFNTAVRMDEALLSLLMKKDLEYITVREICQKAEVNRSTFYLHYETIEDILNETFEYSNRKFMSYFSVSAADFMKKISTCPIEDLNLITPEYLNPYLRFVKDNRNLWIATVKHPSRMDTESRADSISKYVIAPILKRYGVDPDIHRYLIAYYVHGTSAIVNEWVLGGCKEPIEDIIKIIQDCVRPR